MRQVIGSVLAAGFGVQSAKNKQRDFQQGSFTIFVIVGIVFTVALIGALTAVVLTVLASVG